MSVNLATRDDQAPILGRWLSEMMDMDIEMEMATISESGFGIWGTGVQCQDFTWRVSVVKKLLLDHLLHLLL